MDFRNYLLKRNDFVVKMFELFFGPRSMMNNFDDYNDYLLCLQYGRKLPAPKNTWAKDYLWKDFEKYLSELNRERILILLMRICRDYTKMTRILVMLNI